MKDNNIKITHPDLLKEWNYEKNNELGIYPEDFTVGSGKKVWWLGKCGHEWPSTIVDRKKRNSCPYCSGKKVLEGYNDLKTKNQRLADEWHPIKNGDLKPTQVTAGSGKEVWWQCSKGHEWSAKIDNRKKGSGCPYCSGKKALEGYNDLVTKNPELATEWHPTKNGDLKSTQVTASSHKEIWWQCPKGHEWPATINSRNNGSGCPKCAKENQTSFPEKAVYFYIKKVFADAIENYKDICIKKFELDIYIPSLRLGIEYDGQNWHTDVINDLEKDKLCFNNNIDIIRIREPKCPGLNDFSKTFILKNKKDNELEISIQEIINYINKTFNLNNKITINIKKDRNDIYKLLNMQKKSKSLQTTNPSLAAEWHPIKNGDLKPTQVKASSHKEIWWQCSKGHEWSAIIKNRKRGDGCPYCSGKQVLEGFNDLTTKNPEFATEWHPIKNGDLKPTQVKASSHKEIWWQCSKGHEWSAIIKNRKRGDGCPYCSGKQVLEGFNDLTTKNPEFATEWHPIKNGDLKPTQVTVGSNKKVWWKCSKSHEWPATINDRKRGDGCPYCSNKQVLEGYNDLATKNPEFATEWHPIKNGDLKPTQVTVGSNKKVWWKCKKCNHEWEEKIVEMTKRHKCKNCKFDYLSKTNESSDL